MTSGYIRQARHWRHPLGWLSLGLGTLQLTAPRAIQRMSGVENSTTARAVLPLVGARELLHGAGLLAGRRTAAWAWTRVVGDAMDLTSLGIALFRRRGSRRDRLIGLTGAVVAMTAVDIVSAIRASRSDATTVPFELTATTTVRRPRQEVYAFWRRLDNLPTFMIHLDDVQVIDGRHSRWRATAPFGRTVSWDAEVTKDVRDTRIEWASSRKATVRNRGAVIFATAPDGFSTEVHLRLRYDIPGGKVGEAVARYFGEEPHQQIDDDLRRFKQVMETGQVVRSDGAPRGKRARHEFPQHAAQPLVSREAQEAKA